MNTKLLLILLVALAQQESRPKVAPMKEGSRLTGVILEENPPKELKMQSCAANDSQVYEFVQTYTKSSPEEKDCRGKRQQVVTATQGRIKK